jgi:hypothetical protein
LFLTELIRAATPPTVAETVSLRHVLRDFRPLSDMRLVVVNPHPDLTMMKYFKGI